MGDLIPFPKKRIVRKNPTPQSVETEAKKKKAKENYFIDYKEKIAVCGDWFINSRVEGAFLSGNDLAKKINSLEDKSQKV